MKNNFGRQGRGRTWVCVALLLLFALGLPLASFGGEADICKKAMLNCILDTLLSSPGGQLAWFMALQYCLVGHEFCRKYVIPMI